MLRNLKLYAPSLALLVWASVWAAGATSDAVMVVFLLLTAVAVYFHSRESFDRIRRRPG